MRQLNKYEMAYLVENNIFCSEKLEPDVVTLLDSFILIDESYDLENENGGQVKLFAYKEKEDGPLLGFKYFQAPEQTFYGGDYFDECEILKLKMKVTQKVSYDFTKADGSEI